MTRKTEGVILSDQVWADTGDKTAPSFAPTSGWTVQYSQPGGLVVERELMNYNFNQLTALGYDVNRYGSNLSWDEDVTYEIGAVVVGSNDLRYKAVTQNTTIDPTTDDGTNWQPLKVTYAHDANVTISEDENTNTVTFGLSTDLSDKADKTLGNVTSGDLRAKFLNSQFINWSTQSSQVVASFVTPEPVEVVSGSYTVVSTQDKMVIFAQAIGTDTTITLPSTSGLSDTWQIKIITGSITSGNAIYIQTQGADRIFRSNTFYTAPYRVSAEGCDIEVTNITSIVGSGEYALSGNIPNSYDADCSYNNIDNVSEGGLTNVYAEEDGSTGKFLYLNFNIPFGVVGDSSWITSAGYISKAFVIDLAAINNLANKYTTASLIRVFQATPIMFSGNFGNNRKFTAVTTSISVVSIFGGAGSYTNQIEVAAQIPSNARTGDDIWINVNLQFQNWIPR